MISSWYPHTCPRDLCSTESLPSVQPPPPPSSLCSSLLGAPAPNCSFFVSLCFRVELCLDRMGRLITGRTEMCWPQHPYQHLLGNAGRFPQKFLPFLGESSTLKVSLVSLQVKLQQIFNSMFQQAFYASWPSSKKALSPGKSGGLCSLSVLTECDCFPTLNFEDSIICHCKTFSFSTPAGGRQV